MKIRLTWEEFMLRARKEVILDLNIRLSLSELKKNPVFIKTHPRDGESEIIEYPDIVEFDLN